jgi:prefoldin subunit 5
MTTSDISFLAYTQELTLNTRRLQKLHQNIARLQKEAQKLQARNFQLAQSVATVADLAELPGRTS